MSHLRLPAGTDVAEMALFDVDAISESSSSLANESSVAALAASNRLIRFRTGADGGYLLHLFVDEPIPDRLQRFCLAEDKLLGTFHTANGRVAFGGLESAQFGFKPNRHIRSDANIKPGDYGYTAFHTEFPDELVEGALRVENSSVERWLSRSPILLALATFGVAVTLAISQRFLVSGLALITGYLGVKWLLHTSAYRALVARREAAQLEFPSIVIEMRLEVNFEVQHR